MGEAVARNKKAFHDYEMIEKLEAGMVLQGSEVKAIRQGRVNLKDSFVKIIKGEAFLKMMNETAGLKLSKEDMTRLGSMVGADVAFFVSEYESANVSGIGEIVEYCDEKALDLEIVTPPLSCNTAVVYQTYREYFLQTMDQNSAYKMQTMSSKELLRTYDMNALNDLFAPCLKAYPTLITFVEEGWFFSGSGSSFFRIKTVSKG